MTIYREDEALLRERVVQAEEELRCVAASVAALEEELKDLRLRQPSLGPRQGPVRLVSLVPIAIVVGLAGAWLVWTRPLLPRHGSRALGALRGAQAVEQAAEIYRVEQDGCPTVDALVAGRRLAHGRRDDPWGRPYHLSCDEEGPHAFSTGRDGEPWTADDIGSRLTEKDAQRIEEVYGP